MIDYGIHVYSEIGKLKTVLLHRPGKEIENLTPELLDNLLFDDIPYLKVAAAEHDNFAEVLRNCGVNVLYLEDLAAESLKDNNIKDKFLDEVIHEGGIEKGDTFDSIKEYLSSMNVNDMVLKIMSGVREKDIKEVEKNEYPFLMYPMPNLYFTRDPFACVGSGVSINSMKKRTRRRETIFAKYIFEYHPFFAEKKVPIWYDRNGRYSIEGGDILVLSKDVIAVGASSRTDRRAIVEFAKNIFKSGENFKKILIFEIPKSRAYMHLDTVFTMIDYDKFTIHPIIEGIINVTEVEFNRANDELTFNYQEGSLEKILSLYLKKDVKLIKCGGEDKVVSGREQWNDGSNTLAVSPGTVITYERNYVTNEILDKNNIKVIDIKSSELSRGRGGPRCMSMPLYREDIE